MSKVIPVSPSDQVKGKFLHSFAIAVLGLVAAGAAAVLVLGSKVGGVLIAFPVAAAASAVLTALGMMIDLARPLLSWTNPQKAIKQNFNVLIALFADAGILIGLTIAVTAVLRRGLGPELLIGGVFVLLLALTAASYKLMLRFAERRYGEIET
jgi:ABC-2 type transport system permease protein